MGILKQTVAPLGQTEKPPEMAEQGKLGQDGSKLLNQGPRSKQQRDCQEKTSPVSQIFGWMNTLKWSNGGMEEPKEVSQQEKSQVDKTPMRMGDIQDPTKDAK